VAHYYVQWWAVAIEVMNLWVLLPGRVKLHEILINTMKQSNSWEANSHSAAQEIPCLIWNPKVYYCVHKSLPLVPILFLPSTLRSSKWSLPFRFSNQNFIYISLMHATYPAHFILIDWSPRYLVKSTIMKLFIVQFSPLSSSCTPFVWETELHTPTKQKVKL